MGLGLGLSLGSRGGKPSGGGAFRPTMTFSNGVYTIAPPAQMQRDGVNFGPPNTASYTENLAVDAGCIIRAVGPTGLASASFYHEAATPPTTDYDFVTMLDGTRFDALPVNPFTMVGHTGPGSSEYAKFKVNNGDGGARISALATGGSPSSLAMATRETGGLGHRSYVKIIAAGTPARPTILESAVDYFFSISNNVATGVTSVIYRIGGNDVTSFGGTNNWKLPGLANGDVVGAHSNEDGTVQIVRMESGVPVPYLKWDGVSDFSASDPLGINGTSSRYAAPAALLVPGATKVAVRGTTTDRFLGGFYYGTLSRPLVLSAANLDWEVVGEDLKYFLTVTGTAVSGYITGLEWAMINANTGELLHNWEDIAGSGTSFTLKTSYLNMPNDFGINASILVRNKSTKSGGRALGYAIQDYGPVATASYLKSMNEGTLGYASEGMPFRNRLAMCQWRDDRGYAVLSAGVASFAFDPTSQVPAANFSRGFDGVIRNFDSTRTQTNFQLLFPYALGINTDTIPATFTLTIPSTCQAAIGSASGWTMTYSGTPGIYTITVTSSAMLTGSINISQRPGFTLDPATGLSMKYGSATVTLYRDGEVDNGTPFSNEFLAYKNFTGMKSIRCMNADGIDRQPNSVGEVPDFSKGGVPNTGSLNSGPTSPQMWAWYAKIGLRPKICFGVYWTREYVEEFLRQFIAECDRIGVSAEARKPFIENVNELWNRAQGFEHGRIHRYEALKAGLGAPAGDVPIPGLIYAVGAGGISVSGTVTGTFNVGDTVFAASSGFGSCVWRCNTNGATGGAIGSSSQWDLIYNDGTCELAGRRYNAERACALHDIATSILGAGNFRVGLAHKAQSASGDEWMEMLLWKNSYQKLRLLLSAPYANALTYPASDQLTAKRSTVWTSPDGLVTWGPTEQDLAGTDTDAFKVAYFKVLPYAQDVAIKKAHFLKNDIQRRLKAATGVPMDYLEMGFYEDGLDYGFKDSGANVWSPNVGVIFNELMYDSRQTAAAYRYFNGMRLYVGGPQWAFERNAGEYNTAYDGNKVVWKLGRGERTTDGKVIGYANVVVP